MSRRAKGKRPAPRKPLTEEELARDDKPCDPPVACGTFADATSTAEAFDSFIAESSISRLGRRLVDAANSRLDHHDPDRAVALTNAYIALVSEDKRARA